MSDDFGIRALLNGGLLLLAVLLGWLWDWLTGRD
jgi:hypothetical protein